MTGGDKKPKRDVAERLLSIMLSIMATTRGLTKRELYKLIPEYSTALDDEKAEAALEKKFERDIDDLRKLGVDIKVENEYDGDNTVSRYVVQKGSFNWPKDFHLSSKQISLLTLAGSVWQQAAFSNSAAQALDRARAFGDLPEDSGLIGWAPRLQTTSEAFYPLTRAIENKRVVEFYYRKPGSTELTRRKLSAWKLRELAGQWMVTGSDATVAGDDKVRNFLLKRIIGSVVEVESPFVPATEASLNIAWAQLEAHIASQVAELKIRRGSPGYSHFSLNEPGNSEWVNHKFEFMDAGLLADELREFAADIEIIAPAALTKAYREGFERIAADHV